MLTSKEVLEKTGISRATLNNYISWGIVPRPDVLPPEPQDGAAPRIGYFPEDIVHRIEEIQRLKSEGWSITRIAEHFGAPAAAPGPQAPARQAATAPAAAAGPGIGAMPGISLEEIAHPAYIVNDAFEVVWFNDAARFGTASPLARLPADALTHGIFGYLLRGAASGPESLRAVLRFHLALAKQRGAALADLSRDVPREERPLLERLYQEVTRLEPALVAQTYIPADPAGGAAPVLLYAVRFREGLLFLYVPGGAASQAVSTLLAAPDTSAGLAGRRRVPALTQVAVLVADLQDAARLWAELPAQEYFELIDQVWLAVDPIFRRHRGTHGKHPGEGMVGYFLPQPDSSHLWNALLAAQQIREAMRGLSREWQSRKGWATQLCMNTGIDEGQEWLGTLRSGSPVEFTVLGDAVNHAARIAHFSRSGAVWATRNLVGKLRPEERQRLKYGVTRKGKDGRELLVLSIFSRVEDLLGAPPADGEAHAAIARLPVTEILDIAPDPAADRTGGRNPL